MAVILMSRKKKKKKEAHFWPVPTLVPTNFRRMLIPSALSNTGLQIPPPTITKPHYTRTLQRLPSRRSLRECLSLPLHLSPLPPSYCKSRKFIFPGHNDGFAFNFPPDLFAGRTEVIYIPSETTLTTAREAFWKQRFNGKKNSLFLFFFPFFFFFF